MPKRAAVLSILLYSLLISACRDSIQPESSEVAFSRVSQSSPPTRSFYFYQGRAIELTPDSSEFIVESLQEDPRDAIREALSGVTLVTIDRLESFRRHWRVRMPASATARRSAAARLGAHPEIGFSSPQYLNRNGGRVTLVNNINVSFRSSTPRRTIDSLIQAWGVSIRREPRADSAQFSYWLRYKPGSDPLHSVAAIYNNPNVAWAEPDKISYWRTQQDPYYGLQYHLRNPSHFLNGAFVDVNVEQAWQVSRGAGVRVWIIDDGIQANHPDLTNSDPAMNCLRPVGGADAFGEQYGAINPTAVDWHGTAVAGVVGACHNSIGVRGVAPEAILGIVRVIRGGLSASDAFIADAINFAWANSAAPADVIVMSIGTDTANASTSIAQAINNAVEDGRNGLGTPVVVAAGNTSDRLFGVIGGQMFPAILGDVISVGAIDRTGDLANYTPRNVDLVAVSSPTTGHCATSSAGDLFTTDLLGSSGCNGGPVQEPRNYAGKFGGTSAAAPQVAGAAALIIADRDYLDVGEVRRLILLNADPWPVATPADVGAGKLNILEALLAFPSPAPPEDPPITAAIEGPAYITQKGTYTWSAMPGGGTGVYTFQWSIYYPTSGYLETLGTGQSQVRTVFAGEGTFQMRVSVYSGSQSTYAIQEVTECIGLSGCGGPQP